MMSSRINLLLMLIVTAVTVAGCATPPRVQRLADSATRPDGDPVHDCILSTMRTQFGVFAMKSGLASDDRIAQGLVGSLPEGAVRRQREAEGLLWKQAHDATAVARNHLAWCVRTTRVAVDSPRNLRACLQAVEAADLFVLAHIDGRSREVALEAARARYLGFLTDNALTLLSTQVYALTGENDDYRFRMTRFGQCLATP